MCLAHMHGQYYLVLMHHMETRISQGTRRDTSCWIVASCAFTQSVSSRGVVGVVH